MSKASTAYVTCTVSGKTYTYHFTGVTGIEHNSSMTEINTDALSAELISLSA